MGASEPLLERHPTPNSIPGREGHRPLAVVVHTNVGSWRGTLDWFSRPESEASAHYLVGLDGRVAQLVDEGDTARHAGRVLDPTAAIVRERDVNPNLFTVGIEFEDAGRPFDVERPLAQYDAGARIVAGICARWSIPIDRDHVIGHREVFAAKECPGNLDVDRLVAEARAVAAATGP
jgi:N-acetylmuramoyl-L-alanine amidase